VFRCLYATGSKSGGRPPALPRLSRSFTWSAGWEMAALIPRRRRCVRIARLEQALSPSTRPGRVRGRPGPRRVIFSHGNAYLASVLGNSAAGAAKTDTFLGDKYRRIARRRGSKRAIVAVGRSILVIAWHLLPDPDARFQDLGPGYYAERIDSERRKQNHIRQLEALGYTVTLQPTG
jgi:hypothetical protein